MGVRCFDNLKLKMKFLNIHTNFSHVLFGLQKEIVCRTAMPADIVFLVDDSWSVGPTSFQQIKEFIADIIRAFQGSVVGQEGIRFGVTVYSDLSRMRIALTDYSTLEEVLRAVEDVPYEGGNSRTGLALEFLVESVFSPSIIRDNAPK
ncbi:collagen alpha-1(XXI) chain-like, partial [Sinocyclocheilus anshuiensis]|uniref:collagen alpha-1(XXI) chain-like n=1 Tax=Sinocyclocheilus anshuiensis TaxID=1608454 RepID=UPI0007B79AC4